MKEVFENNRATNPRDFSPILNWILEGFEKNVQRLAKRTNLFLQHWIDKHRSQKDENRNTIINHLLSM